MSDLYYHFESTLYKYHKIEIETEKIQKIKTLWIVYLDMWSNM
jgi:hypothetical protein